VKDENAEFTVHEKPPELVVTASPEGVKVKARPSKLQVIEYPHTENAQKRDGGGCYGHDCGGFGGTTDGGHDFGAGGFGGGYGGADFGAGHAVGGGDCGFGHFDSCVRHEHTTYVPSHTPPVHVGPNAPPIHVGPHVPAVHVGPHVPSIHYGTHAPIYHVGPHVPFVHMPPPVTTVHAGPMGAPVHVSSPPTVYHQPPVVYHLPHVVGHAEDCQHAGFGSHQEGCFAGGDHAAAAGAAGDFGGGFAGDGGHGFAGGEVGQAGCFNGEFGPQCHGPQSGGGWGRSHIAKPGKKEKRAIEAYFYW